MVVHVTLGIWLHDEAAYVAKRRLGGADGGGWEFPGGKIQEGETAKDALIREWQEELCVSIDVLQELPVIHVPARDMVFHPYVVEVRDPSSLTLLAHTESAWIRLADPMPSGIDLIKIDQVVWDLVWYRHNKSYL